MQEACRQKKTEKRNGFGFLNSINFICINFPHIIASASGSHANSLTERAKKGKDNVARKRTAARKIYKVIAKANLYISVGG